MQWMCPMRPFLVFSFLALINIPSLYSTQCSPLSVDDILSQPPKDEITVLPACTDAELKVFDKFLKGKETSLLANIEMTADTTYIIKNWEEDYNPTVASIIGTYYSDPPFTKAGYTYPNFRNNGCKDFAAYCKGVPLGTANLNEFKQDDVEGKRYQIYVDENYTPKNILTLFCKTVEHGSIACLTADKQKDCDKDFFAMNR